MTKLSTLRINLVRYSHSPFDTRGLITTRGMSVMTVEPSWKDNAFHHSCIPLGVYKVILGENRDKSPLWYVTNVPKRSGILLRVDKGAASMHGDIHLCDHCHVVEGDMIAPEISPTAVHFGALTEGLSSFILEITQKLPYTEYVREHGYARLQQEKIDNG